MKQETILQIQKELKKFSHGNERLFVFRIDCDLKDRIKTIYKIVFPKFKKLRFYTIFLISRLAQIIDYSLIKVYLYRLIGVKIGKGVFISPDVIIDPHFPSMIKIEDYCILGWGAKLFTHEYAENTYRIGKITIKRGAVIGANSTIRGGVVVGEMSEIPYGSIVIKNVPPFKKARAILTRQIKDE